MKRVLSLVLSLALVLSVVGAVPFTASAESMTDEVLFAKFNYAKYPEMAQVKAAVDQGDFVNAKKELVKYFADRKARGETKAFEITEADANYGMAVLPLDNILTGPYEFDTWLNRFTVTDKEYALYEIDLTEKVSQELSNQNISVMLFERQKQQYPVLVASKEYAGYEPMLVVETAEGGVYEIIADNDTQIHSGNTGTTYGSEQELSVKEHSDSASAPVGNQTRRTYINFPLTEAANQTVEKATMKLYAKLASDCTLESIDVHVISIGDTTWDENALTWNSIGGNIYSYQSAEVPTWQSLDGMDAEYLNVTSRFWYAKPMVYEYLTYLEDPVAYAESHPLYPDGSVFGEKLIQLMDAFATQVTYGFNRTLETGERLNRWVDVIHALIDTPAIQNNPDKFANIVSFMWGDCDWFSGKNVEGDGYGWSNWSIVANTGYFKATEFFPEFNAYSAWRAKVEGNVEYELNDLYNDDMSFREAGPSYAIWCAQLLGDCARMAELNGRPMSKTFTEKLRYASRFAAEVVYPDGYDSNIGDSNYRDKMPVFEDLAEFFGNDSILNAFTAGGDADEPDYYSSVYQDANTALFRNSWNPEEAVYLQFNNNPMDGHAHRDSNHVVMYAYGKPLLVDSGRYGYSSNVMSTQLKEYSSHHNTIEAVGVTMGTHATAGKAFTYSVLNDTFDFATTYQTGYSGVTHTRNVFFAKDGYSIVTDHVAGSASREYRQNWHFMPSSNAEMNGKVANTNFYDEANITIVPASATSSVIRDGYHSADYGLLASSKYASYSKTGANVKFDTLLYPTRAGESVDAEVTDLAENNINKAAIKLNIDGEESYYYVKNTDDSDGVFGDYKTDAKMAYVSDGYVAIVDGSSIEGVIESDNRITSMSFTYDGNVVEIEGKNLVPSTDVENAIAIYIDGGVTAVILNGEPVESEMKGGYLYAARSTDVKGDVSFNGKEYNVVGENLMPTTLTSAANGAAVNWATVDKSTFDSSLTGTYVHATSIGGGTVASTMRTFVPIEGGKTYYVSNTIYNNTGATTTNQGSAGMSAIIASGDAVYGTFAGLTLYSDVDYGGVTSWTNSNSDATWVGSASGRNDITSVPGVNKVEYVINTPEEAKNIMISYGGWGNVELYYGDFVVYEVEEVVNEDEVATTVTVEFTNAEGNAIADSVTEEIGEGEIYIYDAPETITYNDEYYVLDEEDSLLSCKVVNGENLISAVYNRVGLVTVKHTDAEGNTIANDDLVEAGIGSTFDGADYAKTNLIFESAVYNYVANEDDTIAVSEKISENVIKLEYAESDVSFDGILAQFTFDDEEAGFESEYAKATSAGANVLSGDAMRGKSLYLDGTGSNYLNVTRADGEAILTGLEEVTVIFYAKLVNNNLSWSVFMAPDANAQTWQNEHYVGMLHSGASLSVERYNNGRSPVVSATSEVGVWKKYALVIEEDMTTVYVDGAKFTQTSTNKLSDILGSNSVLQIGRANWNSGEFFTGYIDEFTVYNYALSEAEIAEVGGESKVTVEYVDESGAKLLENAETTVLSGVELTESVIPYEKLITVSGVDYVVKNIEGLDKVATGADMAVKVVYVEAVTSSTTFKATKGDSLKSASGTSLTDLASETGSEYATRLMADNRTHVRRAGIMGFDITIPDGEVVVGATVKLYISDDSRDNAAFGTTGANLYLADSLPDGWSRGNVTGFALPQEAISVGAVSSSYVTFDVTDYVTNGANNFAVFTSATEFAIYYSELTSYVPELIIETAVEKISKFELEGDSAVYTSYDGETVTVAVAYYNSADELITVISNSGNTEKVGVQIDKNIPGAVRYKAYVWYGYGNMKPIAAPIENPLN